MKIYVSSRIERIRKMTNEFEMLKLKNHLESFFDEDAKGYTLPEYLEYLCCGEWYSYSLLEEYIEITAKIANIDLSINNPLFQKINSIKKNDLPENNFEKLICYSSRNKVHWGIYAGNTIKDILAKDPEYILWCIINLDHFSIGEYVFAIGEIRRSEYYLLAIEINTIKRLIEREWTEEEGDYDTGGGFDAFEGDYLSWFNYNQ